MLRISAALALIVLSVDAYVCPSNSKDKFSPPEYFGDCECVSGYEKKTLVCSLIDTSSSDSTWGSGGATKKTCTGAGSWSGSETMATWCTSNCNYITPYCPTSHCACTGGSRLLKASTIQHLPRRVTRQLAAAPTPAPPNTKNALECQDGTARGFGNMLLDKTKASDITMCVMFEMMDGTDRIPGLQNKRMTMEAVDSSKFEEEKLRRNLAAPTKDDGLLRFEDYRAHMGSSNAAIKYSKMFAAFSEIADGNSIITQVEWKTWWQATFSSAESSSNSDQSASGVSSGAVVGCVVAAVGAGIGIGYFAKGRQASQGSSTQEREMRMVLAQGDADAEL
jgi:hypothetical protein